GVRSVWLATPAISACTPEVWTCSRTERTPDLAYSVLILLKRLMKSACCEVASHGRVRRVFEDAPGLTGCGASSKTRRTLLAERPHDSACSVLILLKRSTKSPCCCVASP